MLRSVLLFVVSGAEAATRHVAFDGHDAERISPTLEPESSRKFNEDYPVDKRAVVDKHYVFGHPYPAVQDSEDFDRDFVKDENSDGGKWNAQMHYDTLRAKIGPAQAKLEELKRKMDKEYEDWLRAKERAADREGALREAREAVAKARKAAEAAARRVNELEGRSQKGGTEVGGAIGRAVEDVKKEMGDLDECKKALEKAKERLRKLLEERAKEAEKQAAEAKEREKKSTEAREATPISKGGSSTGDEGQTNENDRQQKKNAEDEERWKKEVARLQEEVARQQKNYLEELEDVKRTEKQLEEAAKALKKFRRPPYVDDNGGVYNVPAHSCAVMPDSLAAIVLVVLAVASAIQF